MNTKIKPFWRALDVLDWSIRIIINSTIAQWKRWLGSGIFCRIAVVCINRISLTCAFESKNRANFSLRTSNLFKKQIGTTKLIRMGRNSWIGSCTSLEGFYLILLSFLTRILPSDLVCGSAFTRDVSNLVRSYRICLRSCRIRHDLTFRSYLILFRPDKTLTSDSVTWAEKWEGNYISRS